MNLLSLIPPHYVNEYDLLNKIKDPDKLSKINIYNAENKII